MATITAVPVEEYLRTYYEPDMEYVDGQLVERHVGEYFHSWLQSLIVILLGARSHERKFRIFTEQRVRINDEQRYRIPDICVKALPHQATSVLVSPDLVIEVLSPDDEPGETLERVADYVGAGIPFIWIIDPYKRKIVLVENGVIHPSTTLVIETPVVGKVDFAELFQQLDEPSE